MIYVGVGYRLESAECDPGGCAESLGSPGELRGARHAVKESAVGAPATVSTWLQQFIERTQVDEFIVTAQIRDHAARKHSFTIAAGALRD